MFSLFRKPKPLTGKPDEERSARIISALRSVYDPEIPVNIYDLGLIYKIEETQDGWVKIEMTLTAPACPVAGILPKQVESAVKKAVDTEQVSVDLVWDPPWGPDRMSEEARLSLGMM